MLGIGKVSVMVRFFAMAGAAAGGAACVGAAQSPAADLVVLNARVWTVDAGHPDAEAIAIRGERIVAVGAAADIEPLRGPGTKVVDARGRFVMPGFNDAHIHLMTGGAQLDSVNLRDASSPEEFARRIGERARTTPRGEWVTGGDWDEQVWAEPALPARDRSTG